MAYSSTLAIATGLFEVGLALYAIRSPGRKTILVPVSLILLFLAGYQWLEVFVCGRPGNLLTARLALADVVWLPPLGVLLVARLAAPESGLARMFVRLLFVVAAALAVQLVLDERYVVGSVCRAVIATYTTPSVMYKIYGAVYQIGLMSMVFWSAVGMSRAEDVVTRKHLSDVQIGTLGFILPSLLTEIVVPEADGAMPSVMCHYALVLALFLGRLVVRERQVATEAETQGSGSPLADPA